MLLKLCNLKNTCLLIKVSTFDPIPPDIINFLALKDVGFVGVDIHKDFQIKNTQSRSRMQLILAQLLHFAGGELSSSRAYKSHAHYEVSKDSKLKIHMLPLEKLPVPLFGIHLLSTLVVKMKIPYQMPSATTVSNLHSHVDLNYISPCSCHSNDWNQVSSGHRSKMPKFCEEDDET